ncbi:MAG: hypothetical protein PHE55_11520 [Methylococcaceae bacterium]|nr:hypothetical protein [Methylococcaceae bacterium]
MNQIVNTQEGDELPTEIDFSPGVRGKFFRPALKLNLPVYLDEDVQRFLSAIAARRGVAVSDVANDLLKKDIAILEAMR